MCPQPSPLLVDAANRPGAAVDGEILAVGNASPVARMVSGIIASYPILVDALGEVGAPSVIANTYTRGVRGNNVRVAGHAACRR
jgi:hypothetical protein